MKSDFLETCRPYEIYPVSFYDSNGDGVGDLRGIIEKLDYLEQLGINLIWLNPCYKSPFRDGGYDISDYYTVDPRFGTNEDIRELFEKAKQRGIRILMDLVMGHTSDQHPWFQESQKIEKNDYSDRYIWNNQTFPMNDARYGIFLCGNAERENSYRINYYAHQPALNYGYYKVKQDWQTPWNSETALRNQDIITDVAKYWLKMGAAGFRVDMAGDMVKGDGSAKRGNIALWNRVIGEVKRDYPDAIFLPEWDNPAQTVGKSSFDLATMWVGFLVTIGNQLNISPHVYFTKEGRGGLLPFLIYLRYQLRHVKNRGYVCAMPSCHDHGRVNRGYTDDELKVIQAFFRLMPLVSFCYMGEELGVPTRKVASRDGGYARTSARTPMQWDNGTNLGFSTAEEIYLPVEGDPNTHHTVAAQEDDPESLLNTVRTLNQIKAAYPCFRASAAFHVRKLGRGRGYPFIFERKSGASRGIVIISPEEKQYTVNLRRYGVDGSYRVFCSGGMCAQGRFQTSGPAFAVFVK